MIIIITKNEKNRQIVTRPKSSAPKLHTSKCRMHLIVSRRHDVVYKNYLLFLLFYHIHPNYLGSATPYPEPPLDTTYTPTVNIWLLNASNRLYFHLPLPLLPLTFISITVHTTSNLSLLMTRPKPFKSILSHLIHGRCKPYTFTYIFILYLTFSRHSSIEAFS